MSSRTGNPYRLPRRISVWRDFYRDVAYGTTGFADHSDDVGPDIANWGLQSAEEVAAMTWECLDARCQEDALELANDAAERWLMMLDQLVDAGKLRAGIRDSHRRAWRAAEVSR